MNSLKELRENLNEPVWPENPYSPRWGEVEAIARLGLGVTIPDEVILSLTGDSEAEAAIVTALNAYNTIIKFTGNDTSKTNIGTVLTIPTIMPYLEDRHIGPVSALNVDSLSRRQYDANLASASIQVMFMLTSSKLNLV